MSLSLVWNVLQMLLYAIFLDTELVSSRCAMSLADQVEILCGASLGSGIEILVT